MNQLGAPWPLFDQCGGFWASLSVRFRLHVERSTFCSPFTLLRNECHVLNVVNFVLFDNTKNITRFRSNLVLSLGIEDTLRMSCSGKRPGPSEVSRTINLD